MMISALRPSSWVKNLAILPAWVYFSGSQHFALCIIFLAATAFSAGNYLFNEWSDRFQDAAHPTKKNRFFVRHPSRSPWPILGITWFAALGLAGSQGLAELIVLLTLMLASILYNAPGIRIKNRAHLDYLLEALNAPLRGTLGWLAAGAGQKELLPWVLATYFTLSLSVMLLKRRGEVLRFTDPNAMLHYRPSLGSYTSMSLTRLAWICLFSGVFFFAWAIHLRL
jgi:decaprenyl-phosphate phosphoribosyltransferase